MEGMDAARERRSSDGMKQQAVGMLLALLIGLGIGYAVGAWQESPFDRCIRVQTAALAYKDSKKLRPHPGVRAYIKVEDKIRFDCSTVGGR